MTCNENSLQHIDSSFIHDHFKAKLSDDVVSDLVVIGGAGEVVTGSVTTILVEAGVIASAGTIAGAALVAIIAVELAWLAVNNNGCGITIDIYMAPSAVPPFNDVPYHNITPQ